MTPERFEELAQMLWANVVGARLVAGGDGNTYTVTTPSIATVRVAITAIYPLIRNEVIEECAVIVDDDDGHFTWSGEDKHVRLLQGFASDAATAIRALKTKEQS